MLMMNFLNCDHSIRRKAAMSCPQTHSLGADCPHALHNEIQRLISSHAAPGNRGLGVQSCWIAKNLAGAAAAHAKDALTVRIGPTTDCLELAAFHLDQHSAKRRMTIHGTHGRDDFCVAAGHGHFRFRHLGLLSKMDEATIGPRSCRRLRTCKLNEPHYEISTEENYLSPGIAYSTCVSRRARLVSNDWLYSTPTSHFPRDSSHGISISRFRGEGAHQMGPMSSSVALLAVLTPCTDL